MKQQQVKHVKQQQQVKQQHVFILSRYQHTTEEQHVFILSRYQHTTEEQQQDKINVNKDLNPNLNPYLN